MTKLKDKQVFLQVRMSAKERRALHRKARKSFKSVSQYVRDVLRTAA
jgi:hypothetical protein